jgi:2',3'-cyclic-nucleotide 2'-phosphodiesterase
MSKILFFGDVFGRPGRAALKAAAAEFRAAYSPDVIIANVENLTHGKGVTENGLADLQEVGIDCFTSGNHVFDKGQLSKDSFERHDNLIRPVNYLTLDESGSPVPGHGFYRFAKDGQQYLVINLNGTVFFEKQFPGQMANPFFALDKLLEQEAQNGDIIIVDLHAEATSEKQAMGFYADGRVTAVVGTHTHVPTADSRLLPKGTAYCTDVGFCGPFDSVIGVTPERSIATFIEKEKFHFEVAESDKAVANAVLIETDGSKPIKIEKLSKQIDL